MSYCLLFYFTKSLNPISFLIIFLHSLSAIWTDLLVLTLALFIFIHSHFHYSFIFISLTAFLIYGLTSTVSLNKLSYSCSAFCWHLKSSSFTFTSPHLVSFHFISSSHLFLWGNCHCHCQYANNLRRNMPVHKYFKEFTVLTTLSKAFDESRNTQWTLVQNDIP